MLGIPVRTHQKNFCLLFFTVSFFFIFASQTFAVANHVVISEIQVGGEVATDEFVELYNPTNSPINLNGWRLSKKTSTGTLSNLATTISGTIPAYGYFLIAHEDYNAAPTPDQEFNTGTLASDNTVLLYSDAGVTLVDKVGFGDATDKETATLLDIANNSGAERKAQTTSTAISMNSGGADEFFGNGEDTDNNSNDFIVRTFSQPQNSSSSTEQLPVSSPTPTFTPSPSPTPSPTPSNTPSPTPTSTPLSTATSTPTVTPTPISSPQPTPTGLNPKIQHFRNIFQGILLKLRNKTAPTPTT